MKKFLVALACLPLAAAFSAHASEAGYRLDRAPIDSKDLLSLQAGARTFVNYCLNCHGAQYMRYNRLTDLGLSESQIRDNLIFTGAKVGETMKVALTASDGKAMFGAAPPDLTVIGRARSADWLYTYLRTFHRDANSPTGWNNAVFPQVAMPHALWTLQGERALEVVSHAEHHAPPEYKWTQVSPGAMDTVQYDTMVRDLVNYLVYMGEPAANSRKRIGIVVLFFLGILLICAYALKKEYWKDVK
jgi:ubiquinol-cytochrome c reductase cytochrome c1 subunit